MIVTILSETLAEKLRLIAEREGCTPEEILHDTLERSLADNIQESEDDERDTPFSFRQLVSRIDLQADSQPIEIAPALRRLIDESA